MATIMVTGSGGLIGSESRATSWRRATIAARTTGRRAA